MGPSENQQQYPIKKHTKVRKFANIVKWVHAWVDANIPLKWQESYGNWQIFAANCLKWSERCWSPRKHSKLSTNTVHANGKQVIRGISPGCITLYIKYITLQIKYIPLGRLTHTHIPTHTHFSRFYQMKPLKTKEIRVIRSSSKLVS